MGTFKFPHVPICTGGPAVPVSKRWPQSKDMYTTHKFEINTHFNFPVFRSLINKLLGEFRQNGVWTAASNIRPSRPASVGLEMHQKAFWESSKLFVIRAHGTGWALVPIFANIEKGTETGIYNLLKVSKSWKQNGKFSQTNFVHFPKPLKSSWNKK